jgi:uncharacterized DUF497 family protein
MEFRWNDWNLEHVRRHGVSPDEAELVVQTARRPFPRRAADGRFLVWGRGVGGRLVQVVFLVDPDYSVYIIHARPLSEREKRRFRQRPS